MTTIRATIRTSLTAAFAGSSLFSMAAEIPSNMTNTVVTCGVNARCSNKMMFGRSYKVMATAKLTVMVALSSEGGYTRADVSIANNGDSPQSISPQDFRVEVFAPKAKVLPAVPAESLQKLTAPVLAPVVGAPSVSAVSVAEPVSVMVIAKRNEAAGTVPLPANIDELFSTAKREAEMRMEAEKEAAEKLLQAAAIPANEVVRGRIYFEKDPKAKGANVVLPVAGMVFEFPYSPRL